MHAQGAVKRDVGINMWLMPEWGQAAVRASQGFGLQARWVLSTADNLSRDAARLFSVSGIHHDSSADTLRYTSDPGASVEGRDVGGALSAAFRLPDSISLHFVLMLEEAAGRVVQRHV